MANSHERSIMIAPALCALLLGSPASDLRTNGAFGFPQRLAVVLCDTTDLRLSATCDSTHLFVQAIIWKDNDSAIGSTDDGRKIGDWCDLAIDCDADGKATRDTDREYTLNPWPSLPGLHYSIVRDENSTSGIQGDSKGRGSIQYLDGAGKDGAKVRVDTFLIPFSELKRKAGDEIRFAYWASSPKPELIVNSVGFTPADPAKKYYSHHLPREKSHSFTLAKPDVLSEIDVQLVPEGRDTIKVQAKKPMPKVGSRVGQSAGEHPPLPEISAAAWRNWKGDAPPTLASLKDKVVVVEFWATWCAPCIEGIPHLNDLHKKHAAQGLVILSMTDQERGPVEKFIDKKGDGMSYPIGMESETAYAYGVSGIPHAFVIDRSGKLVWHGNPHDSGFDKAIVDALKP